MSGSASILSVCKDCFYRGRIKPDINCIHYVNNVSVMWNDEARRHETTDHIRPFPEDIPGHVKYVAMCDPHRGTCRKDKCTFAHGRTEQKAWNSILRGNADRNHMGNNQPPQNPWPDLLQQQPPQFFQQHFQQQPQYFQQPLPQYFGQQQPPQYYGQQQPQYLGQQQPLQYFGRQQYFGQQPPPQYYVQQQPQYLGQQYLGQLSSQYLGQQLPQYVQPCEYAITFEGRLKEKPQISDIEVDLEHHNYKKKFYNLICWEERRHIEILQNKCDQKYTFTVLEKGYRPKWIWSTEEVVPVRYGYLSNVSNDQIDYATQASEGAYIISQDEERQFKVKLMKTLQDNSNCYDEKLYVAIQESDSNVLGQIVDADIPDQKSTFDSLSVEFEVKHGYFNQLVKAMNAVSLEIVKRIQPLSSTFYRLTGFPVKYFLQLLDTLPPGIRIDTDQFRALCTLLSCNPRSPPVLINGAFGTGKTRLLAVITHCVIKHGVARKVPVRVLICAHHQASADHLVEQYFGQMFSERVDVELVRLVSRFHSNKRSRFQNVYKTIDEYIYHNMNQSKSVYLVVVTTFLTSLTLLKKFQPGHFTHIFLDEGAQSREPEAIGPLCLAGADTKIVVAGDSCQVGPSLLVLGKEAQENGLKLSLLERLQILYQKCGGNALKHMVSLNTNYRCHEDVMRIPNDLFYDSKIKSCSQNASLHPQATYPLLFVCSSLTSDINHRLEANLLLEEIKRFVIESWPECWGKQEVERTCLVTASQSQLVITRNIAREKFYKDLQFMHMLTSYRVQGQEFQAIFISTTEPVDCDGNTTNPTKSPCDPFVFNTVLTRSKSLIVAVGSPEALLQTEEHMVKLYGEKARCWSNYMRVCLQKKTFIVPPEVENNSVKRQEFLNWLATRLDNPGTHETTQPITPRPIKEISDQPLNSPRSSMPASDATKPELPRSPLATNRTSDSANLQNGSLTSRSEGPLKPHGVPSTAPNVLRPRTTVMTNTKQLTTVSSPSATPSVLHPMTNTKQLTTAAPSVLRPMMTNTKQLATVSSPSTPSSVLRPMTNTKQLTTVPSPSTPPSVLRPMTNTKQLTTVPSRSAAPSVLRPMTNTKELTTVSSPSTPPSVLRPLTNKNQQTTASNHVSHSGSSHKSSKVLDAARHIDDTEYPDLKTAKKISKRKGKQLAAKSQQITDQRLCISSPNISTPTHHSSYYEKYKDKLEDSDPIMKEPLTAKNYKEKFHLLLCWEEKEHHRQLSERCNKVYDISIYPNGFVPKDYNGEEKYERYGYISSDDGDTLAHIKQACQGSFIVLDTNSFVHAKHINGHVPYVANSNAINIGFSRQQLEMLKKSQLYTPTDFNFKSEVNFELKHSYFAGLHRTLDHLPEHVIQKLIPTNEVLSSCTSEELDHKVHPTPYESIKLDQKVQMKALYTILKSSPALPILVAGPFGTGKTRLLARAAYEILKKRRDSRVLICAHHQASADTFMEYFGELKTDEFEPWDVNILRVMASNSYESETRDKYFELFESKTNLSQYDFERNRLVVTTLGTAPSLFHKLPNGRKDGFFSDILIDEGAQTREPETVGPLNLAGPGTRIVIAGDHCQVGPKLLVLGEKAQSNGLGISLLERLYILYSEANVPCSVKLINNYRCHQSILMLPSSLYYHSTLQCRVPDNTAHSLAPFPLTFVCSDIEQGNKKTSGINEIEADVLLKEVQKYFAKWPRHWEGDSKKICIISPSPNQRSHIRRKIRKIKIDCRIELLTTYELQGNEFQAIFISTSEPTTENGEIINTTKTLCDRFVFNTALTRSRSLVVAVGNPFFLLKMEKVMINKYGDSYRTWSAYIEQCVESKTFSYSETIMKKLDEVSIATHQLYDQIFSDTTAIDISCDTIIRDYTNMIERQPGYKKAKLSLSSGSDSQLTWNIEDDKPRDEQRQEEAYFSDRYLCNLKIYTYSRAEAIPHDSSKKIVKIRGAKNRKGAFDGDTVEIGTFDDNSQDKCYGRVLKVTERGSDLKFVCRVSSTDPIVFYPIDGKNPVLINVPRLTRLKKSKDEMKQSDLKSNDVVVFDPKSYDSKSEDGPLPRVRRVIPLSIAREMLFLVSFVTWEGRYHCPLGIVIGAYHRGDTFYNAERLMKLVHSVEYMSSDNSSSSIIDTQRDVTLELCDQAFTIDPEDARNLDDALSITRVGKDHNGREVYQLGVHIVNAAKYIQPDSAVDVSARKRGISVYGGRSEVKRGKVMHMLSNNHMRCKISLTPGEIRDVISVTCRVAVHGPSDMRLSDCIIKQAQIKSAVQLTYKDAQCLMDGNIPTHLSAGINNFDQDTNLSLQKSMGLLYAIARSLRLNRLQSDAVFSYQINDPGEDMCWQAHLLVEELMIWANGEVAKTIHSHYPNTALLRKQPPPNVEKKESIVDSDQKIMTCSLKFSHLTCNNDLSPSEEVLIPVDTLKKIHKALNDGDNTLLAHLLSTHRLYPQLAALSKKIHSISLLAEYCCTDQRITDESAYRHDSLCLDSYTHFTSPMRRYIDIEVQRMLLEVTSKQVERKEFDREDHVKLCTTLNRKTKSAKGYEKKLSNVQSAIEFTHTSQVFTAFISKEEKNSVELVFPDLKLRHFNSRDNSLRITKFLPSSKEPETDIYVWKLRISSMKGDSSAQHFLELANCQPTSSSDDANLLAYYNSDTSSDSLEADKYVVSQHSSVVKVSPNCWLEALNFVKDPSEEKMAKVKEVFPKISSLPASSSLKHTASKHYRFFKYNVKASLKEADVFKVWLTWSLSVREPVISPAIQLVEISPLLRICMQHNSHPAECFSDPNLSQASKMDYDTIWEYIKLWKKVLLAEAAEKSVSECQPVIIQDVHLLWPNFEIPKECIEEHYYVPTEMVTMTYPEEFFEHCYEFFNVMVGSLVCVRYGCDPHHSAKAVYHFVVHNVKMPDDTQKEFVVSMEPVGKWNCRVSATMKEKLESKEYTCEVQIILMSPSYRRVFGGLLALGNSKSKRISQLSRNVAVDHFMIRDVSYSKQAESVASKDKLVKSISEWKCSKLPTVLNRWQEKALKKALCKPFQLIQGPPGTGKSVTGAHIAYAFAMVNKELNKRSKDHQCVLYCGPSNKSVDVVFEIFKNLLNARKDIQVRILRIYGTAVEERDYPGPKHEAKRTSDIKCPDWAKPYALHHLIRKEQGELQELDEQLRGMRREGKIASGKLCNEYKRVLAVAEADFLSKAKVDIIFCTCNEAAGRRVGKYVSVRQCIIDECGMAYEPETIVPISKCEHAVLIGDHKQLQPVIDHQPAKENGLTTSLFERYAEFYESDKCRDKNYITLRTQYRMHESICEFPSEMFYDNKLETDLSVKNRPKNKKLEKFWPKENRHGYPIMFVNVVGEEGLDKIASSKTEVKVGVDSKFNIKEAELVIKIVETLHYEHKIGVNEIAVLTPYTSQKSKLLEMVKKLPKELTHLKIASVMESQGDEYGVVVLSTVRSQPLDEIGNRHYVLPDQNWEREHLGFITDQHRINVGITRSKYALIITGNKTLLEYDRTWKKLLEHYENKKCVVEASQLFL